MLNERGLYEYSFPPPKRTPEQDRPTLLVTWWCCACCVFIILCRVVGRYNRTMRVFRDDKWMAVSAVPLVIRMGLIHAVLTLGTNNVDSAGMGEDEVRRRVLGSRLVLCARVMYTTFIWSQKFCITEFYKRLTVHFWGYGYDRGLKIIRWTLVMTFAAAVISIFAECRPSHKLWQVKPDPGPQCRESLLPLVFFGSLNVFTDLLLIFFPVPAIIRSSMRTRRKIHLIFLFSLSVLPVTTTLYRIPAIIAHQRIYGQPYRSLWASIEALAACVCANAVILNTYARGRGEKREKFRQPSHEEGEIERSRRTVRLGTRVWGSDLELAGDVGMGMGMDPELRSLAERSSRSSVTFKTPFYYNPPTLPLSDGKPGQRANLPLPAPAVSPTGWGFDEEALQATNHRAHSSESVAMPERVHDRGRRVSFCDVGGLLRDEESPGGHRRGSGSGGYDSVEMKALPEEVVLNDVGGLLGTVVERDGEV